MDWLRPAARQAHDDLATYLTELVLALFDGTQVSKGRSHPFKRLQMLQQCVAPCLHRSLMMPTPLLGLSQLKREAKPLSCGTAGRRPEVIHGSHSQRRAEATQKMVLALDMPGVDGRWCSPLFTRSSSLHNVHHLHDQCQQTV